ncbi:MAG: DUF4861 family protein [Spirochaetales bacterium]|jgi:hypothetical protein|nr:DUF4861 family protein [Spirochaetales bacterium]
MKYDEQNNKKLTQMKSAILIVFVFLGHILAAQNKTDVSLFLRSDSTTYLDEISSESGDLYNALGHHGPAIENEWLGLRIYFDHKAAIDVYSKTKPGLELRKAQWYPTPEQQKEGWGADYYKVGSTVGLGGIRLWDGEKVVALDPVSQRWARVVKEGTVSFMEMLSVDVPYKNRTVDILVRVTVYSGLRKAKVEAFALTDSPVQFVTGINYHEGQQVVVEDNRIFTWGLHPEDVAVEKVELGAVILFNPADFEKRTDSGTQHLLISKPGKYIECWISSANANEQDLNTLKKFMDFPENKTATR